MEINKTYEYLPSSPVHPFEIVEDEIAARGLTKKEFADSIGMKPSNFSRMIKRKGELTSEMALKLEAALNIPYRHWMRFQEQYVKDCARINASASESSGDEESCADKENTYDDWYIRISSALRPIRERMENINAMLDNRNDRSSSSLSEDQICSIENDIHLLGKALCDLKLS